jgi:hypothetical protein
MKTIPLSQGLVAIVDDDDFESLSAHRWYAHCPNGATWYAVRNGKVGEHRKRFYMHRVVLSAPKGAIVDHIDGNGLRNTKSNLRICTYSENARNRIGVKTNPSGFKGVKRKPHLRKRPWVASIQTNKKVVHLGCFATPEEAARAYDEAALLFHGPFARLNFPKA